MGFPMDFTESASSSITSPTVSTDTSGKADAIAPRRRNGRPQACEPCRKRKTACDHTLPVCSRCKRRSTTAACIYLDSPVAQARNASVKALSESLSQPQSPTDYPTVFRVGGGQQNTVTLNRRTSSSNDLQKRPRPAADLFGEHNSYLGETSFSAIFKENKANLDAIPTPSTGPAVSPGDTILADTVPEGVLHMGVKVLKSMPDPATARLLSVGRSGKFNYSGWTRYDTWINLAGERVLQSLWEVWDPENGIRAGANQEKAAIFLCNNTCKPLQDEDDPERWRDSFSGLNLRWETLGLYFTFWAYGVLSSNASDLHISSQPPPRNDPKVFVFELLECARACITICHALESENIMLAYLLLKHRFIESIIEGDASPSLWRRHGELVAVTLSIGLHRVIDTRITLSLELQRRVWARIYGATMTISSFMGRPPLLSYRYAFTALPLDIDDADLMSDPATLADALSHLDANGWDTRGKLHGFTLSRARMMMSKIKEDVMELVLGASHEDVVQRAHLCRQQLNTFDAQLPRVLHWDARDILDEDIEGLLLGARLIARLEYLHGHFMVERFINKQTQANTQVLFDLSRECLSLTLNLFKHPDRFYTLKNDVEWLIMTHAVPASGVLCLAILQQRVYGSNSIVTLPRAEVIQDLSVFVAFLDRIKPTAPNAELCYRIREIVGKVLNQALEPPILENVPRTDGSGLLYNFELPDNFLGLEEFGNFDLMDTYDWVG